MSKSALRKQTAMPVLGLDTSKPGEWIGDQNSPSCQNVDEFDGQIRSSYGTTVLGGQVGGTSKELMAGIEFKREGITHVIRISADQAEALNLSTATWSSISASALDITVNDEVAVCAPFLSGSRIAVFTSAVIAPQKYTGTGNHADLGGSPPKAKYCATLGPYTLLANITDSGGSAFATRVQWCDTGAPENWSTGNSGYSDIQSIGDITGIKEYGNYVAVHKKQEISLGYLVQTDTIIQFDQKYTPGTICHNSIQNLPDGSQVYLATDGIRVFTGSSSTLIDSPINTELRDQLNLAYAYRAWSIVVRDLEEYWIGVPLGASTDINTVYRFNYNTGQIFKRTFAQKNIRSAFNFSNIATTTWEDLVGDWESQTFRWDDGANVTGGENPLLQTTDGYTLKYDKTTVNDNGLAVNNSFDSKDYHVAEALGQMIRWNRLELWAKGNSIKVSYSTDKGTTWTLIENKTLSADYPTDDAPLKFYFDVVSSQIRFRFNNDTVSESFHFKQFVVYGTPREARGL